MPSVLKVMAPKQIFKDLVIAFSGDFGDGGGHSNKTHAHLSGWVTLHGGQVVPDVTPQTTHLICSMEDYEKKSNRSMPYYQPPQRWNEDC